MADPLEKYSAFLHPIAARGRFAPIGQGQREGDGRAMERGGEKKEERKGREKEMGRKWDGRELAPDLKSQRCH